MPSRTRSLPSLPTDAVGEQRLRAVFHRALREALVPGLALGLAACDGRALGKNPGTAAAPDGAAQVATSDAGPASPIDTTPGPPESPATNPAPAVDAGAPLALDAAGGPGLPRACGADGWSPVDDLHLAQPVQWLSARQGSQVWSTGVECLNADHIPACEELVAATIQSVEAMRCGPGGCAPYFVATDRESVRALTTHADVVALFGAIDTAQEAAALAWFDGYTIRCNDTERGGVRAVDGGFEVTTERMTSSCPIMYEAVQLFVARDGTVKILEHVPVVGAGGGCVGRRPEGLEGVEVSQAWTLTSFLAEGAALEAASVSAFKVLARDLRALGAPPALVEDALAFAVDEVRHAGLMAGLAERHGAAVKTPRVHETPAKSLRALCLENAVEGCVRETFGALVARFQAEAARDGELREVMAALAEDETRHAHLAWRIADWAEPQLDADARAEVRAARRAAVAQLRDELSRTHAPDVYAKAGWPAPAQGRALVAALESALWA